MPRSQYAIVDMGTNTFHLLIASVEEGNIRVLHKEKQAVRLGAEGISKGIISEPAIERAVNTLIHFQEVAESMGVEKIVATATSAVRSASNRAELLEKIYQTTGIIPIVISGEAEALLIYEGVKQAIGLGTEAQLIMDIGGGSVEFIIANKEKIFWKQSFEIGGQRLMDRFQQQDPIEEDSIEAMNQYLEQNLQTLFEACNTYKPQNLIGASGTFDTLAQMDSLRKGRIIDIEEEKYYLLDINDFYHFYKLILPLKLTERKSLSGMISLRAEMIVVAMILIDFVLKKVNSKEIKISTYSLKEGVLAQLSSGNPITGISF